MKNSLLITNAEEFGEKKRYVLISSQEAGFCHVCQIKKKKKVQSTTKETEWAKYDPFDQKFFLKRVLILI